MGKHPPISSEDQSL
jgi:hypothetical protein